jgi:putative serine protease PepD
MAWRLAQDIIDERSASSGSDARTGETTRLRGTPVTCIHVWTAHRVFVFPAGATVVIGRADNADVFVESPAVDRYHARLVAVGHIWHLIDDSINGTWVDSIRISSLRVERPVTVCLGDPAGDTTIRLEPVTGRPNVVATAETPAHGEGTKAPPATQPERQAGARESAPVVVTRLGGKQQVFPVGTTIRVGRDPSVELTSANPLVSRRHGVIVSDEHGATYTDHSRRGSFIDGKRLRGPLRIIHSVILYLGDPATGEELGITPPLTSAQITRNRRRKTLSGRLLAGVAAAAAIAAAALVTGLVLASLPHTAQNTGLPTSSSLPAAALGRAEAATVRLLIGSQASYSGWGSGTLISPDGLILTNAHVAEPEAPGAAVAAGLPASQLGPNPPFLTVELTTGQSSAAVARFRARPVAVDGYLDLAIIRIYATANGQPVSPASLHLPYLTLGNVGSLQLDQAVTVLGFPGVSGSSSITVTSGVISTFVPDPLGHVTDPRFELETTARVAHGNSGGAAIDNSGRLIGVPSLAIPGEGSDVSWRLRSVAEAKPLIAAARSGTAYRSTLLVQPTGSGRVIGIGVGITAAQACSGSPVVAAAAPPLVTFGVGYVGFPRGLDIAMLIRLPDGTALAGQLGGLPQSTASARTGCFSYSLIASQLGLASVPNGTYQVQLLVGPDLAPIGAPANVTVSSRALPPATQTPKTS